MLKFNDLNGREILFTADKIPGHKHVDGLFVRITDPKGETMLIRLSEAQVSELRRWLA